MNMHILFLLSAAVVAAGLHQPEGVVRELFSYIVDHRPLGVPRGEDKASLSPLLSARLMRQLETVIACEDDYYRQAAGADGKPAFGWLETGLFSGSNELALPSEVAVERTEPQCDGSFRVYLHFTYRESSGDPAEDVPGGFHWRGAAIVRSEDDRFVVDDILLFEEGSTKIQSQLSRLSVGCDGPRWIGLGN